MIFYKEVRHNFCGHSVGESPADEEGEGIRGYEKARGNVFERGGVE